MDRLVPDIYAKSLYTIDYEKLKDSGIKCILFDLDNTIAPVNISSPSKDMKKLVNELENMGFKLLILSNSPKNRVRPFKEQLNIDSAHSAGKPFSKKYKKIMKVYNFKDTEMAAVGDQLLTDILGANLAGITSILVNPISDTEYVWTKFNRFFEKFIYKKFEKREILKKGKYYD
ncbi:MAG: YqeG family HAD IIIA-type phosphatase [Firmicutes bacterium]|nr:YqeG family HAD IIIA-type phosphatase [Bacillota bacterium]